MTSTDPRLAFLEPRDDTDPFCTCPHCRCLGTHRLDAPKQWEGRWVRGMGDDRIATPLPGDPPHGTWIVVRTCVFCGHQWWRSCGRSGDG